MGLGLLSVAKRGEWYIDSGASQHMTPYQELLTNIQPVNNHSIATADNSSVRVSGKGESNLLFNENQIQVSEILHVPNLAVSLLSVYKIASNGNTVIFNADGCRILNSKGKEMVKCKAENGVYKLCTDFSECMIAESVQNDVEIWHRRLGHMRPPELETNV